MSRAKKIEAVDKEDYIRVYRITRNKYVSLIKKEKTNAWISFVNTVGNEDPWSIVYKIVCNKSKRTNYISSLTLPTGQQTTNWTESINALLDKCVPADNKAIENNRHRELRLENKKYYNSNLESDISYNEIEIAIKRLKCNKAPGYDGFTGEIMKALWSNNKETLSSLFNRCLRDHEFPEAWKTASLRIILKNNKDKDRDKLNSYRPIALLSIMGKIFVYRNT